MCGRFTQTYSWSEIGAEYALINDAAPNLRPSWNVAPTQEVGVVLGGESGLSYQPMAWGLVPFWAKDEKVGAKLINARAETVAEKPAFRAAFKARRCIIPATGFFEWRTSAQGKQPHFIAPTDGRPFSFAGLWERWGNGRLSCTIITTEANGTMRPLHERMPVILARDDAEVWVKAGGTRLLRPCPDDWLHAWPVDRRVGSPKFNVPECIAPVTDLV